MSSQDTTEPWRADLDKVLSSIQSLDANLRGVPGPDLGPVAAQLRAANRTLWRLIDQLEAGRVSYIYDTLALARDLAESMIDDPMATFADVWLALVQDGLVSINDKELLKRATKKGLVVEKYLEVPDDDDV